MDSFYTLNPVAATVDIQSDLRLHYRFEDNEIEFPTINDQSGNGLNATANGSIDFLEGKLSGEKSIHFDEDGELATIADTPLLRLDRDVTISAWVNNQNSEINSVFTKVYQNVDTYTSYGLNSHGNASGSDPRFVFSITTDDTGELFLNDTDLYELNRWYHVVGTYDGSTMRLYVNGVLKAEEAKTGNIVYTTEPIKIGDNPVNSTTYSGKIDDIRLYNRALTPEEVQYIYDLESLPFEEKVPSISSISPLEAVVGEQITLTGTYFGDVQGSSTVKIGTSEETAFALTNVSWGDAQITGTIPSEISVGSYPIWVTVNGKTARSASELSVISAPIVPEITTLSETTVEIQYPIQINGANFGETQGSSLVKIGDSFENSAEAFIESWTNTKINIFIFDGNPIPGEYKVWVKVGNAIAESPETLTIIAKKLHFVAEFHPFITTQGISSTAQSFFVYGESLSNEVEVLAFNKLELSKSESGTYNSKITLPISGGELPLTKLWVRLSVSPSEGDASDFLVIASTGAVNRSFYVQGQVNAANTAVISAITPNRGSAGFEVSLLGSKFGASQNENVLQMELEESSNRVTITPNQWGDNEIKFSFPSVSQFGKYSFFVTVNGVEARAQEMFTYVSNSDPTLTAVNPTLLKNVEQIQIFGNNFGSSQGNSSARIGFTAEYAFDLDELNWSSTLITAKIPSSVPSGDYSIWLTINGTVLKSQKSVQIFDTNPINTNTLTINGISGASSTIVTGVSPQIYFDAISGAQDYRVTISGNAINEFFITTESSFSLPFSLSYGETYMLQITPRFSISASEDPIDGESASVEFSVFSYPATVNNSASYSFSGNLVETEFKLLGVSGTPKAINSVITLPSEDYKVFRWTGSAFQEFYSTPTIGSGYWLIAKAAVQFSSANEPVSLNANNEVSVPIVNDWNILSNPFESSFEWTTEIGGGQGLYEWNGGWVPVTVLQPSKAYAWKNITGNTSLILNYYDLIVNPTSAKRSAINDGETIEKQVITLTAKGNEKFGSRAVQLAIYPEKENQDITKFDTELPPQPFEMSALAFLDETNSEQKFIRKALTRNELGYSVPLSFELLEKQVVHISVGLNNDMLEAGLINLTTGRYISLNKDSVVIPLLKGTHFFQFVAGEASFVSEQHATLMPKDFTLIQNYPNPFNPSTQITFSLPQASAVKLEVFDLLGRRVALIADEMFNPGYHTRIFNASKLSSGMYLYRIQAGDFVQVKKMLLLK